MDFDTINDRETMESNAKPLHAGRYRIVKRLGQGGMGSVWLAEDIQLDNRLCAIKTLPSILVSNKRAYRQLKEEALMSMKLTHSNIVTLRAFEENNGNPFLVMDYVDGETLDDYLGDRGILTEEEVISLLKPIAEALDYAHKEGVVHRDIKPANVMIRKDGHPYILDFGIAREIQETMTRVTGKLSSGTLLYMSPEQLNGESPKAPQDIYSFGAMVYECLKGAPPFIRGQIEHQILNNEPTPLAENITISKYVQASLAKRATDRPTTCLAVLGADERAAQAEREAKAAKEAEAKRKAEEEAARKAEEEARAAREAQAVAEAKLRELEAKQAALERERQATGEAEREAKERAEKARQEAEEAKRIAEDKYTEPKTGDLKTITLPGGAKMKMIYVGPGEFIMGSSTKENGRYGDAKPHRVQLTKGYWLGKYEVTQAQWESVMGNNPSYFKGSKRPVENVSWADCQKFIEKVNARSDFTVRLPTEAEWEYACRAGSTTVYSWGNALNGDKANCNGNIPYGTTVKGRYKEATVDVGLYEANQWGFHDMHGNVWEWCQDWYGDYSNLPTTDPKGTTWTLGANRVMRGGSWFNGASVCASSYRNNYHPYSSHYYFGFRLACSAGLRE